MLDEKGFHTLLKAVNSAIKVIECNKEAEISAEEIHRTALVYYKKVTDMIREIVGNKTFDETIIGNQSDNM